MATLANTSCLSSFQLRWGLRCKKCPPILYSIRFRAPNRIRTIGLVRADAGKVTAGDGSEDNASQPDPGTLSVDKFAGWFGEDYDDGSSEEGNRFGGISGAVLAGIFLAGGLAFASLSLSSRRKTEFKPQMQPLNAEQEILFSDSENEKIVVEEKSTEGTLEVNGAGSKSALQVQLGKVLIPAVVDQVQGQALAALQVLKVIEADVQPGDICTRREYARWLVSASSALSRCTTSKVYPAMYIENVCELAFDDITPEDPDFPYIQGLAESGLISSKLSRFDNRTPSLEEQNAPIYFSPASPLSRQDLVSWKMALEKRVFPEVDRKTFHEWSGYLDIDKINPDAWPAIAADLSSGENGIIALAFGYTRLFQPEKPVTKAQAAVALSTGDAAEVVGEELTRIEAESLAETAVLAQTALFAEVEKDLNASFERELAMEREKIDAMEKLAQEARLELEKLRSEREEENNALIRGQAAVESEMEILSRLRNDVEEQLQNLLSNKTEIAFERNRVNKLREEAERENLAIVQLQYELEVERKALAMARAWAEDEAKRARKHAKALEEARERWEKHGIKVIVDEELRESAYAGVTWQTAAQQVTIEETVAEAQTVAEKLKSRSQQLADDLRVRAEQLVSKLNALVGKVKGKSAAIIERLIQKISGIISLLKHCTSEAKIHVTEAKQHVTDHVTEVKDNLVSKASTSMQEFKDNASGFGSSVRDSTRRATEDLRESLEKITQRFKL